MPLSRPFTRTLKARAIRQPKFRAALLREAADCLLGGDHRTAMAVIRDYIKAVSSYAEVAKATGIHEKSLVRMFGPSGNPTTSRFANVFAFLQKKEGLSLTTSA
jgi:DNA-binding phage protein